MKKITLAMFDQEGYTCRLADYLCRHQNSLLDVRLFTNKTSLHQFLEKESVDLLLIGEQDWEPQVYSNSRIHKLVILSSGDMVREGTEQTVIFKYQSAETIVSELLAVIAEADGIRMSRHRTSSGFTEFIGIFSPFGGAGVSSFSFRIAREYGVQYRTLYLNLELFEGMTADMTEKRRGPEEAEGSRGMSELIFYLRQRKDKTGIKLLSLTRHYAGIDCIGTVEDYRDLYSMRKEDLQKLLEVLAEETEYQKIIFDIGFISETSLELMRSCDCLYLPLPCSEVQKKKQESFQKLLLREGMEETAGRIQFVNMKEVAEGRNQ